MRKRGVDNHPRVSLGLNATNVSSSRKLKLAYDWQGRRIRKRVYNYNTGTSSWPTNPNQDLRFVYDQWNLIMVIRAFSSSSAVVSKFTWGLDLSGQNGNNLGTADGNLPGLHGAGGVGGLLAMHNCNSTSTSDDDHAYIYFYDGNGNVCQLVDATLDDTWDDTDYGDTVAKYEYYPFGGQLRHAGPAAGINPFQFSTKYRDQESALYYYSERYHKPRHGRWISRDPIGEEGGINQYCMVSNAPILLIDPDGRKARVSVNELSCTITVALNIGIYGECANQKLATRIKKAIETRWNGHLTKRGCDKDDKGACAVVIMANVKYYSEANHWWSVSEDNQIKFNCRTKRSWVIGPGGTWGHWETDADWTWAHEAGHLMGLWDHYIDVLFVGSVPLSGHSGHMMGSYGGKVAQHEIDGILQGKKCPGRCCCPSSASPAEQVKGVSLQ